MRNNFYSLMGIVVIGFFLVSCQAHMPEVIHPEFKAVDLNAKWKGGAYKPKADNFVVILDASRSAGDEEEGRTNFAMAKDFLYRMNQTLPNMELNSALRSFGHWSLTGGGETNLDYGPTNWNRADFQTAVDEVPWGAGRSPVDQAFYNSSEDMASMAGKTAVILVGDGEYQEVDGVAAAKRMKTRYGESTCIYTVLVGRDKADNFQIMQDIASAGECGFYQHAGNLESPQGMADWVEDVFLEKVPVAAPMDSDGDGVYDNVDQCPGTPKGIEVDSRGCPLDSDGDGVYDYRDKCPDTPKGASVDARGCWVIRGVNFDTAKSDIKPSSYQQLDEVAAILRNNPGLKVEIQGHTDNRGSAKYNQNLSERRANAVMEYLVGKGISPNRLTAFGYGYSKPATSNDTPAGRAQNRRVELKPVW
jgi:OOP family OmpA-OmpF porin